MIRLIRASVALVCAASLDGVPLPATAMPLYHPIARSGAAATISPYRRGGARPLVQRFRLPNGENVTVYPNGLAQVSDARGHDLRARVVSANDLPADRAGTSAYDLELRLLQQRLSKPLPSNPYAPNRIVVAFKPGYTALQDDLRVQPGELARVRATRSNQQQPLRPPQYTNDAALNAMLASLGAARVHRLFSTFPRSRLASMHALAQGQARRRLIDISNVFRIDLNHSSVVRAVASLRKHPGVDYVSPDFTVTAMLAGTHPIPAVERAALVARRTVRPSDAMRLRTTSAASATEPSVPTNFGVTSSLQSFLDASGIDAVAAYGEVVDHFHQLPGTGVTITNVSLGTDVAAEDANGPAPDQNCVIDLRSGGSATQMIGGQRFLNWPSLPLIPFFAADANGRIDSRYESCGEGDLGEVGLDFAMMAPLPDDAQRAGERSNTLNDGDLLGVAPGANYRLVVPATNAPDGGGGNFQSDLDGVFLAAATQVPKPDIITTSLGQGFDVNGFPARFLEDDPVTQSVIATIVTNLNVVVCVSANDGLRAFTSTAVGPSGGSAPTNVTAQPGTTTSLSDIAASSAPSVDLDSGSIDVGSTTLNDIFSRPPLDPANQSLVAQLAYPETRYNGSEIFSSGFGPRVTVSAPGDNVIGLTRVGPGFDAVTAVNEDGTSASAPEVAAVAAVAIQVARLTGHPLNSALAVRDFLVQTATPVAQAGQTDAPINVGPQVNVRRAVEQLLAAGGIPLKPSVGRVAVAQRRSNFELQTLGTLFFTFTDPGAIDLLGHDFGDGNGPDGTPNNDWITIAPDWRELPANAVYALTVAGRPNTPLAVTPFARVLPAQLFAAAFPGQPQASSAPRTVRLQYRASQGLHTLAQATFELTFSRTTGNAVNGTAPLVAPVVRGTSFNVAYDATKIRSASNLALVVTTPGRFTISDGFNVHTPFVQPLSAVRGTVSVPTSALQGAGLYGVSLQFVNTVTGFTDFSEFATFRLEDAPTARPAPPLLGAPADTPSLHSIEIPRDGSVRISWDVRNVPNATGAVLEVSAPGPTIGHLFSTFNNPNGSIVDDNGIDTGSVKALRLSGSAGLAIFAASDLGLRSTMLHTLRVIPMAGGAPAGEASDVSSIVMDGQTNAIGGSLDQRSSFFEGGFAVDPAGNDAIQFATNALTGDQFLTSVESFDQTTHQTTQVAETVSGAPAYLAGGGYFALPGNPLAIEAQGASPNFQLGTQYAAQPFGLNAFTSPFTLPVPPNTSQSDVMLQVAVNPSDPSGAALLQTVDVNGSTSNPTIAAVSVQSGTVGQPFPTNLCTVIVQCLGLFGADIGLNMGVVVREVGPPGVIDFSGGEPVVYDLIDLGTGVTRTIPSQALGSYASLAIDESSHVAAITSSGDNTVELLNLRTGSEQKVALPVTQLVNALGGAGVNFWTPQFIAADPVNHLFLMVANGGATTFSFDENATSALYVMTETGSVLKTIFGFQLNEVPAFFGGSNYLNALQVNGQLRKAYLMDGTQLSVIDY